MACVLVESIKYGPISNGVQDMPSSRDPGEEHEQKIIIVFMGFSQSLLLRGLFQSVDRCPSDRVGNWDCFTQRNLLKNLNYHFNRPSK